jgi:hypothetical protein
MTVIAHTPFHPRGCITICQSDTPCLCIMTFRISRRVGFDKTHLWLCYHEAPAADTLIASGLLGMERRERPLFLIILKGSRGHNLYPSLAERFFHILRSIWVLSKTAFSYVIVLIFLSFAERFWAIFNWDQFWEGLDEFLFEIRALILPVCGF